MMRTACVLACAMWGLLAGMASAQEATPTEFYADQQNDDRVGELEAQVVSLRQTLDAAMASNPIAPEACTTCGGCSRPVCKSCGPETCAGGLFITGDYLYLRATQNATPYAGSVLRPTGTIDNLPINANASLTSELLDTRYDRHSAFRIHLGYMLPSCWDFGVRYTYFRTTGNSTLGDPTLDSDAVLANRLDRNMANLVVNANFDDGYCDFAAQALSLRYSTYDLELGRYLQLNSRRLAVRALGGFRFAEINQVSRINYVNIENNGYFSADTDETMWMTAWGMRAGAEAHYLVGWGFSVFARGSGSLMYADFDTSRIDLQKTPTSVGIRTITDGFQHMVPVAELNLGARWQYGGFYISGGYDMINWFNMVQGIDATLQDDVDGTSNNYRIDRRSLGLDGFFVETGLLF